jgi:hypothetical protein
MAILSEHHEQALLVQWFRRTYPGVLIYAIPNGGARGIAAAARLKVEGVVRGIPDLHIPAWGLWVEMKRTKGGRLSPEQTVMIAYLDGIGQTVIVGVGFEDAKEQIVRKYYKTNLAM